MVSEKIEDTYACYINSSGTSPTKQPISNCSLVLTLIE